ncbi:hypothetical protein LAZ67_5002107 [Cordylochernes scorpioides]|uniref:Uncharacterized protein n=1 Tax=Cordylochernes scorpioides TaxID=51811 RepID=A0ABY6KG50_9ARAC|nr:hypothetical protein LAZ67_5002107 [Cordylochernes scorpioides]
MRRVAAKFVPKLLNCDQKQHRMNIANEMLDSVRDDPNLLQRVITGDEAWVYGYDVETKAQSAQWKLQHEPRPEKARQVRSNFSSIAGGVVHHEFLPQGRTINKEYYLQVMRNLRKAILQKHPDLWKNKNWLLHHDNAPAHTLLLVHDFLAKNNTLMMPQPPYSPDLAPCDFFLFPKLKRPMKGRRYATLDEIKTESKEELKKILKTDFLKCFEDWKNHWHKCIISHGDYFEGDKIAAKKPARTTMILQVKKKRLPVETDPEKLVNYVCGLNYRKDGEPVKLKPDSEYPDWLWNLRLEPPPPLHEMDPNTEEYWHKVAWVNRATSNFNKSISKKQKFPVNMHKSIVRLHNLRFRTLAHKDYNPGVPAKPDELPQMV